MNLVDKIEEFEIDLTGTCNLRCDRCSRNYVHAQHLVGKNIRPLSEICAELDQFPRLKTCMLAGQTSEPTLYPEFTGFLRYLKNRGIHVDLYTNASKNRQELFKEIGEILSNTDTVIFTICGSTQELHQRYRIGSKLTNILDNASALRAVKPIDVLQYIRFKYNFADWKSNSWKNLGFTKCFWVESEGPRIYNETINPRESEPVKEKFYETLFGKVLGKKYTDGDFVCSHLNSKKIYIDQFGRVYPCYTIAEYDKIELSDFDYNFPTKTACKLCTVYSRHLMQKYGLDFLC